MNAVPAKMQAILLTAHGGPEVLHVVADHPVPKPGPGEVLIKVGAAGMNNTDINTRIGWYSKAVRGDTHSAAENGGDNDSTDSSWSGAAIDFPRIQGADACGTIIGTGDGVDASRLGQRVLVRAMQPLPYDENGKSCITFGSEIDGGFAEYAVAQSDMALTVESPLSDAELASFPCPYSTAENMLERIGLTGEDRVLITGASGGVGSAAVQLAKRRGCEVIAQSSSDKADFLLELGADQVIDRNANVSANLGAMSVDVVVDVVAGPAFSSLLDVLKRGGRYIAAGAIAGPIAELDVRTLYLKDLTLAGSTYQPLSIMENLVRYIEAGEIKPVVSKTFPLSAIGEAQDAFLSKRYPGKLVLVPDALYSNDQAEGSQT